VNEEISMNTITLEVALLKEGTQWVAVSLDAFLVAQGPTKEDAVDGLKRIYNAIAMNSNGEVLARYSLSRYSRTPPEYRENAADIWLVDVDAFEEQ
jgi:hypothetical protein